MQSLAHASRLLDYLTPSKGVTTIRNPQTGIQATHHAARSVETDVARAPISTSIRQT